VVDSASCLSVVGDVAKVGYNLKTEGSFSSSKCKVFECFFLMNDDDQSVYVMETPEIDLEEIIGCLKQGDSIFIHCKES